MAERRFTLLRHDWPFVHLDLLIEDGDACLTWRLAAPPSHVPVAAEAISRHRLHYLDYEGPVPGGRGSVARVDRGTAISLSEDHSRFEIVGETFRGVLTIQSSQCTWIAIEDETDHAIA